MLGSLVQTEIKVNVKRMAHSNPQNIDGLVITTMNLNITAVLVVKEDQRSELKLLKNGINVIMVLLILITIMLHNSVILETITKNATVIKIFIAIKTAGQDLSSLLDIIQLAII